MRIAFIIQCSICVLGTDSYLVWLGVHQVPATTFRLTVAGVLHLHQEALLKLDFIHGAQFLTKLPDDLAADLLFRSIEAIHMNVGRQKFGEVLANHIDRCQREPS
jgi:hypothetical protein